MSASKAATSPRPVRIFDVAGLQTALDGKQAAGSYAPLTHTHPISDVVGLQTALDGKAALSHTHTIANVTGLQTALDGKQAAGSYAAAVHTHVISDVTGLQAALDAKALASAIPAASNANPAADGTAAPGTSTTYARGDHVHPLPTGRLSFIGNVTVSQTVAIALTLGMRRIALTLSGVTTSDKLFFAPITPCAAGCEAVNVYPSNTNEVTVTYYTPALVIGSVINIPIAVYRVT